MHASIHSIDTADSIHSLYITHIHTHINVHAHHTLTYVAQFMHMRYMQRPTLHIESAEWQNETHFQQLSMWWLTRLQQDSVGALRRLSAAVSAIADRVEASNPSDAPLPPLDWGTGPMHMDRVPASDGGASASSAGSVAATVQADVEQPAPTSPLSARSWDEPDTDDAMDWEDLRALELALVQHYGS